MAIANIGRCLRADKIYSRARTRVDTMQTVDAELADDFEFPIVAPDEVEGEETLAQLMAMVNEDEVEDAPTSQ